MLNANGSFSAPSIGFSSESNSGIYRNGTGNLSITCSGTKQLDISSTNITSTPNLKAPNIVLTDVHASNNLYATGSWTVTVGDGTNNFSISGGGVADGEYTRIGNVYHCWINYGWTSKGSASGNIRVSLPVATNGTTSPRIGAALGYLSGLTFSNQLVLMCNGGDSYMTFYDLSKTGGGPTALTNTSFASSGFLQASVFFSV